MSYIDKLFHFYETTSSFENHNSQGLISPDSLCFIEDKGQIYTQGSYFGINKNTYEALESFARAKYTELKDLADSINTKVNTINNNKNKAGGFVALDDNTKISSTYLPSYVDDVLEYNSKSAFPKTGEAGKIYVALDSNLTYRWSGSEYVEISKSLALGETSSTAYAGDKGKQNASDIATCKSNISSCNTAISNCNTSINNHKADTSNPHKVTAAQVGLGNVNNTSDANKPISNATQTALDKKVDKVSGKELSTNDYTTDEKNKLAGIEKGAQVNTIEGVALDTVRLIASDKWVKIPLANKSRPGVLSDTDYATWTNIMNRIGLTIL